MIATGALRPLKSIAGQGSASICAFTADEVSRRASSVSKCGAVVSNIVLAVDDVAEVDRHHQQFGNGAPVRPHCESASTRGKFYSICFNIVGCELCGGEVAGHFHIVIMSPKQSVRSKVESLQRTMAGESTRQVGAQNPPNLATFPPRLLFFHLDTMPFQKEWSVEVGPHRVAVEVCAVFGPPSGAQAVPDKGASGKKPFRDDLAVQLLDRQSFRGERCALASSSERRDRGALLFQPH